VQFNPLTGTLNRRANLWRQYFENKWTYFNGNPHRRSKDKGMRRSTSGGQQEVKGQGHPRPKIDLKAFGRVGFPELTLKWLRK